MASLVSASGMFAGSWAGRRSDRREIAGEATTARSPQLFTRLDVIYSETSPAALRISGGCKGWAEGDRGRGTGAPGRGPQEPGRAAATAGRAGSHPARAGRRGTGRHNSRHGQAAADERRHEYGRRPRTYGRRPRAHGSAAGASDAGRHGAPCCSEGSGRRRRGSDRRPAGPEAAVNLSERTTVRRRQPLRPAGHGARVLVQHRLGVRRVRPGSEQPGYDDTHLTPVTLPHCVTRTVLAEVGPDGVAARLGLPPDLRRHGAAQRPCAGRLRRRDGQRHGDHQRPDGDQSHGRLPAVLGRADRVCWSPATTCSRWWSTPAVSRSRRKVPGSTGLPSTSCSRAGSTVTSGCGCCRSSSCPTCSPGRSTC